MYHYLSKLVYGYGFGVTYGLSIYTLLIYNNYNNKSYIGYLERFSDKRIVGISLSTFLFGCYIGYKSEPSLVCLIPYKLLKHKIS